MTPNTKPLTPEETEITFVVAVEIGSSEITGVVAKRHNGKTSVVAAESTKSTNSVRYGRIFNVQDVSTRVKEILQRLENNSAMAGRKITKVFFNLGGRSLTTVHATGAFELPDEIEITSEAMERLKRDAVMGLSTDKEILDAVPRKFFVNNKEVDNLVGTFGRSIRGDFTVIVCAHDNKRNLQRLKLDSTEGESAGRTLERVYMLRPLIEADMVLTPSDRELGCVLLDVGAETTTMSIYKENALQYISTLPLGSRNITRDLMTALSITEDRAELLKFSHAAAAAETSGNTEIDPQQREINNFVHARVGELIANITYRIDAAGYKSSDLPAGIIVIGRGAKLKRFKRVLSEETRMKVRPGTADNSISVYEPSRIDPDESIDVLALVKAAFQTERPECTVRVFTEPVKVPVAETETETVTVQEKPLDVTTHRRRTVTDDDPDLLRDDPEDDELLNNVKRESWLDRRKRKKAEAKERRARELAERERMRQEEESREEEEIDEDDYIEEDEEDDQVDVLDYDATERSNVIERAGRAIFRFFSMDSSSELDDDK